MTVTVNSEQQKQTKAHKVEQQKLVEQSSRMVTERHREKHLEQSESACANYVCNALVFVRIFLIVFVFFLRVVEHLRNDAIFSSTDVPIFSRSKISSLKLFYF